MNDQSEAEAYASASAQEYLDTLDDTLVKQSLDILLRSDLKLRGEILDVGCGPGGIALKIAKGDPAFRVTGVDRSAAMIQLAHDAAAAAGLSGRVSFLRADGNGLCFRDASFDLVISNSVLHHLANPVRMLREIARVVRPEGTILVRDLRRPSRPLFPLHVWWHGRYYSGLMKTLYRNSVHAAYNASELNQLLADAGLNQARIFTYRSTHIGFVRPGIARDGSGTR